ncbi:hypothetical protein [Halogeometricum limi]|uniref:Uncharacterized protein n=1 Tax=Halogeometricum limi TaxID=555875 RepID=A0A1I6IF11_9EURY|nr:hypothetical protein [Halogeometricum limi]SFR65332.1 hypothetical protein SAMN04488124_3175 [Halogeometricum limi]
MSKTHTTNVETESPMDKFYLPGTSLPTDLGRVEAAVTDLFTFHGRVLIPRTYNR